MSQSPAERERVHQERLFHESQAQERSKRPGYHQNLLQNDQEYLNHASWIEPGIAEFGNLKAKTVLDWGCGHGMASISIARKGASVISLDLSKGYCKETWDRAHANGFKTQIIPLQGDACRLPFKSESFDGIWGNAILHHLVPSEAAFELNRVLKSKGVLVLCDPWQGSFLAGWIRGRVPYPGKDRTKDEKPLVEASLAPFRRIFPNIQISYWDLLGSLGRFVPLGPLTKPVRRFDQILIKTFPGFARTARYVMIKAIKD